MVELRLTDDGSNTHSWSYPIPYPSAFNRVGKDSSNYVAFWKEVRVVEYLLAPEAALWKDPSGTADPMMKRLLPAKAVMNSQTST